MKLILVRHGQTAANTIGALDTAVPGHPLNEVGFGQAEDLVRRWVEHNMPRPDVIATSTLLRTQQTARPLAEHFGLLPIIRDGLREIDAGDMEMSSQRAHHMRYLQNVVAWMTGNLDCALPGAPNGHEILGRFTDAVNELTANHETTVVVAHGAIMRLFCTTQTQQIPAELAVQHPVPNTQWCVFEGEPGDWRAIEYAGRSVDSWHVTPGVFVPVMSQTLLDDQQ